MGSGLASLRRFAVLRDPLPSACKYASIHDRTLTRARKTYLASGRRVRAVAMPRRRRAGGLWRRSRSRDVCAACTRTAATAASGSAAALVPPVSIIALPVPAAIALMGRLTSASYRRASWACLQKMKTKWRAVERPGAAYHRWPCFLLRASLLRRSPPPLLPSSLPSSPR